MRLIIFGGTSEAHALSDQLTKKGIAHTLSVATEYGRQVLGRESVVRRVCIGRLSAMEIARLLQRDGYDLVVDATHPYAVEITENIGRAVRSVNEERTTDKVKVIRLDRQADDGSERMIAYGKAYVYPDTEQAAQGLAAVKGNILLTTGSKELGVFASALGEKEQARVFVRVIPSTESIRVCSEVGIEASHIIAMQGPFTQELNQAIIRQYDIRHLVTKDSGTAGGLKEKTAAAEACDIAIHIIRRPVAQTDMESAGYEEVLRILLGAAGEKGLSEVDAEGTEVLSEVGTDGEALSEVGEPLITISLIGMGMGDVAGLTNEASALIRNADVVIGSKRLVEYCESHLSRYGAEYAPLYKPGEIAMYLEEYLKRQEVAKKRISAAVVFSGDSGFYSGCKSVYEAIRRSIGERFLATIRIYPGISSVSALAAKLGRPYEDAYIGSMHGRGGESIYQVAAYVRTHSDVYALTGGWSDITKLATILTEAGLGDCRITVARDLASEQEKIITKRADRYATGEVSCETAKDKSLCNGATKDKSLYTCHIYNPVPMERPAAPGLCAEAFVRGRVPMTKEEVRAVTIAKLHLTQSSRVLDIGCGTGSVTVEIARLIPNGMVYAYDENEEAVRLTRENRRRHRLPNVVIRQGSAPEVIAGDGACPTGITHVFIGGNKGRLTDILNCLKAISERQAAASDTTEIANLGGHEDTDRQAAASDTTEVTNSVVHENRHGIRVVLNVITERTKTALRSWLGEHEVFGYDVVKVAISRGEAEIAENAVWIYSFEL